MTVQRSDKFTYMNLGKNLKNLIHEHDISVAQVARATKIGVQTIHNWLSGQKPRDISQVKKVADYFKISVDSLCFETGKNKTEQNALKTYDDEIIAGIYEVVLRKVKK